MLVQEHPFTSCQNKTCNYKKKNKKKKAMFQMNLFFLVSYFKKDNVLNNTTSDICCSIEYTLLL